MLQVSPADEPDHFDSTVRQPGHWAIAELAGEQPNPPRTSGRPRSPVATRREDIPPKDFPPFWREALRDMMNAYNEICAYSCIRIHPITGAGTVDHMVPKSKAWNRVYEWLNYRLASSRMNARKNDFEDVLDPFDAIDGWFQLSLFDYSLKPAPHLQEPQRRQVMATVERLGLNEESLCSDRDQMARDFFQGDISFAVLTRGAPFIARELRRQGKA